MEQDKRAWLPEHRKKTKKTVSEMQEGENLFDLNSKKIFFSTQSKMYKLQH